MVGWAIATAATAAECAEAIEQAFVLAVPHVDDQRPGWIPPGWN
jgi:hypothetical protein